MKFFITILFLLFFSLTSQAVLKTYEPWLGNQKMLVLLLAWDNEKPVLTSMQVYDTIFKDSLSLASYFNENSQGQFNISGETTSWNSLDQSWPGTDCEPNLVAESAKDVLKQNPENIDFTEYDSNQDGKIDHLLVIHSASVNGGQDNDCYSSGQLNSIANTNYISALTMDGGSKVPIGMILFHGAMRYYGFSSYYGMPSYGNYGIGMWGMMGLGTWGTHNLISREDIYRYPSHFRPRAKAELKWAEPILITESKSNLKITPIETGGHIYQTHFIGNAGSYNFLLEYRSEEGFSKGHPGHGLIIWDYWGGNSSSRNNVVEANGASD